ncbi:18911_t:CDS:2 [Acaulospora morrowiae]|uniref:18911_t:CDS:1 n=1 Tax=Acaulospora morrowiae TaxID=94023 RepID=A0A9N9C1G2_9GLOM|nr:18911_t:CDS:2 [Acaulospora morrowiae]
MSEKHTQSRPRKSKLRYFLDNIIKVLSDYVIEPILIAYRFTYLLILFLPLIIGAPALFIGPRIAECENERMGALWWYDVLVRQMENSGPTFIKLAQWAASRTDIFPREMCSRLSKLHSDVNPHSFEDTKKIIEREFGKSFYEIFSEIEKCPIGVGAIAQVYKATMRPEALSASYDTNNLMSQDQDEPVMPTVAVKVLHPKAEKTIQRDLKILMIFSRILDALPTMRWLSLPEEVMKFSEMMQEQLDLRKEANNLLIFRENFKNRGSVEFPKPFTEYTTKNVLIEEFEEGLPIKLFLEGEEKGIYDHMIANIGLDAFLHMLIFDNFVHADLHPGNIMVKFRRPNLLTYIRRLLIDFIPTTSGMSKMEFQFVDKKDMIGDDDSRIAYARLMRHAGNKELLNEELTKLSNEGYLPRLIFIDTGLVTGLNVENRRNFLDLFRAITEFDGYRAGKLMMERCKTPHLVIDGELFALKMQHLVLNVRALTLQLGKIRISDLLTEVFKMVRTHHVKLEGDFINIIISILLLEGIGRQLDSQLDLLRNALPILRKLGAQEGGKGLREGIKDIERGGMWWMKFWFWLEAREWIDSSCEEYDMSMKNVSWPDI